MPSEQTSILNGQPSNTSVLGGEGGSSGLFASSATHLETELPRSAAEAAEQAAWKSRIQAGLTGPISTL